jgi:hypothetical protein
LKGLTVVGLAYLLTACVSSPADLRPAKADRVADFPAAAADLSDCVHRAMKRMDSPYAFRLIARPDKLEFFITTTRESDAITQQEHTGLELHFMAHGKTTTVEMREDAIGVPMLSGETWTIIERCSQQVAAPPAASSPLPYPALFSMRASAAKRAVDEYSDSV